MTIYAEMEDGQTSPYRSEARGPARAVVARHRPERPARCPSHPLARVGPDDLGGNGGPAGRGRATVPDSTAVPGKAQRPPVRAKTVGRPAAGAHDPRRRTSLPAPWARKPAAQACCSSPRSGRRWLSTSAEDRGLVVYRLLARMVAAGARTRSIQARSARPRRREKKTPGHGGNPADPEVVAHRPVRRDVSGRGPVRANGAPQAVLGAAPPAPGAPQRLRGNSCTSMARSARWKASWIGGCAAR